MQQYKLNTDLLGFEKELMRFCAQYRAPGLVGVHVGRCSGGLGVGGPLDRNGQPAQRGTAGRWSVEFTWRIETYPIPWPDPLPISVTLEYIGGERPWLLTVDEWTPRAGAIARAWLEHCCQLWDALPVGSPSGNRPTERRPANARVGKNGRLGKRNADTEVKLAALLEERDKSIQHGRVTIAFSGACKRVEIKTDTVKRNWPELHKRWSEAAYRPALSELVDTEP